jgi:hypothetical protein
MADERRPLTAGLILVGGLALSTILIGADFVFLGVMVGVITVPAAFTTLVSREGEKYY